MHYPFNNNTSDNNMTTVYNTTTEDLLFSILTLDNKPYLCTSPVEESSYLDFKLYSDIEGFQMHVEPLHDNFIKYLDSLVKECVAPEIRNEILRPVLARLLIKFKQAKSNFIDSSLRTDWKLNSKYFKIFNPKKDYNIEKEQKYTRLAYGFFYNASCIQLNFINKIIAVLDILDEANPRNNELTTNSDKVEETSKKSNNEKHYYFTINTSITDRQIHQILANIHKELKNAGYIDCSLPQFKHVFTSKNPEPIVWLKPYVHLSYLIKIMTPKILHRRKSPSNYETAGKLFHNQKPDVFFIKNKWRHDKDPAEVDRKFISKLIHAQVRYIK
jgi:hypothetical protein